MLTEALWFEYLKVHQINRRNLTFFGKTLMYFPEGASPEQDFDFTYTLAGLALALVKPSEILVNYSWQFPVWSIPELRAAMSTVRDMGPDQVVGKTMPRTIGQIVAFEAEKIFNSSRIALTPENAGHTLAQAAIRMYLAIYSDSPHRARLTNKLHQSRL